MTSRDAAMTRRQYLSMTALLAGAPARQLRDTVATTARQHPEWDMDEVRTYSSWERAMPGAPDVVDER